MATCWTYDDNDGIWNGPNGWTYEPIASKFEENYIPRTTANVPHQVRADLENTARGLINDVLGGAVNEQLGDAVQIDNEFGQGGITDRIVLGEATFGSGGAAPCLIVFVVGTRQGKQVAVGAHIDDQIYNAPDETVADMLQKVDVDEGTQAFFYVFGGEVGCNTNPGGSSTMDYSRYYMFFKAIVDNGGVVGRYNFPSNGNGETSTAAAIALNLVRVWHD